MKRWLLLSVLGLLLGLDASGQEAAKPAPLTKEQQARLKERERLLQEANKLASAGKPGEALPLVEKALAIEPPLWPSKQRADWLGWLADYYEQREDFPAARNARQEVLALETKRLGAGHWQVTDARLALAQLELLARLDSGQRRQLQQAEQLNRQMVALHGAGKFGEALVPAREALGIYRQVLGDKHPHYAASVNDLAFLYQAQGEYGKAEPLYQKALEIRRQVLGDKHPHYALSLSHLAVLYVEQGEYSKAEPLLQKALEIRRQVLGDKHPDCANSLNHLGHLYFEQGEYGKAEPFLQKALEIRRQVLGDKHPDYATSLSNLAVLYEAQAEYGKAEFLFQKAREITRQVRGDKHPYYASDLNNLAAMYQAQGEYGKAEPLYQKALEITRQVLGDKHPNYAQILNNLALLYDAQGDYGKAEPLFLKALKIRRQVLGDKHPNYAGSLINLAALYQAHGDYGKAEPLYQKALEIYRQVLGDKHPHYALNLNNLALLYTAQGDYGKAEPLLQKALEITRQALGDKHPAYADRLINLAHLYQAQGEFGRAEPLCLKALAALAPRLNRPLSSLAQLSAADLRADPHCVTAVAIYAGLLRQSFGERPSTKALHRFDQAVALALALRERHRSDVLTTDASKLFHGSEQFDLIPARLGICRRLFQAEGKAEHLHTAFATAEQGSARLFLETLGKGRGRTLAGIPPELQAQEQEILRTIRLLELRIDKESARPLDKRDVALIGRLFDDQHAAEAKLQQLVARLTKDYPAYAGLKYPRPCTVAQARACLHANEVALLFVPGSEQSWVLLLEARPAKGDKADGLALYPLPVEKDLAHLVDSLTDPETLALPARVRDLAQEAYEKLLAPLQERLRGKDLVIVAGGPLGYLPFELLVDPDGKYLVETRRIRYAPSLTALHLVRLWEKKRRRPDRPLWALGDPVFDAADPRAAGKGDVTVASRDMRNDYLARLTRGGSSGRSLFPRLPATAAEVAAIRDLVQARPEAVVTGLLASEATVKAASESGILAQTRYVHFATHGILGAAKGRQPALVLTLVGNDTEDGFLELDEVANLKLNADLVVLSACRSGGGRLARGEGVSSMGRAFLYAGCRGVLVSLWSVADQETATLMTDVYRRLKSGKPAADALREAQLTMIQAGKAPRYWAPFILIGGSEPGQRP